MPFAASKRAPSWLSSPSRTAHLGLVPGYFGDPFGSNSNSTDTQVNAARITNMTTSQTTDVFSVGAQAVLARGFTFHLSFLNALSIVLCRHGCLLLNKKKTRRILIVMSRTRAE